MTSNLAEGITPGGGSSGGGGTVDEAAIRAIIVGYDYLTDPEVDIIVDMAGHVTAAEVHTLIANAPATGITQTQADAAIALAVTNAGHASQVDLTAEILARESAASTIVSAPLTNTSLNMITAPGWYLSGAGNTFFPPAVTTVGLLRVVNTGGNTRRQDFYTGANDTPVKYSRIGTTTAVPGATFWTWQPWVHVLAVEDTGTTGQVLTSTGGSAAFADLPAETFSTIIGAVDLNTLIIPGRYATAGTTNHPVAADAGGTVIVERNAGADTGFIRQTYQATASFDTFSRYTFDITGNPIVWLQWDEVNDRDVKNQHITTARLADEAVTEDKLADGSVTTIKIADDAVTEDKLAQAVVDQLGGGSTGGSIAAQTHSLFLHADTSDEFQQGTFPVSAITNYYPSFMNFTADATGATANPLSIATAVQGQTEADGTLTFSNVATLTFADGVVFKKGVPVKTRQRGGIRISGFTGQNYFMHMTSQAFVTLETGVETPFSVVESDSVRIQNGTAFISFSELSTDQIGAADATLMSLRLEYTLHITTEGTSPIGARQFQYYFTPNTRTTVIQINPEVQVEVPPEVPVVSQAYNLYISNDSSNAAQAGTFPVTQITNYFPGYMNFTQVADGSVANPFTEATGITVTNTIANNTFPNIENVTSTAGIVLYAGVPIHIKASGGLNLDVTSGLPSGVVLARVIRKVLLNGAEISSERTGGFRVRAGLVYLPFDELSYDFIPQADTPYNGSHVEYDLEFTNSTGARITTSQSLKYWLEPDTKEVITQLSPVLRQPKAMVEVELFRGNLRKQMFHSVQLTEAIPANAVGVRNVIEVSFDTANYDDATSTWNNDVGRARVPLIPVNARDLNEIDEYVLDGYAGVAGTFADFDCIPLITHTLGSTNVNTESPSEDDSPHDQSVGVFLYRIRNAAGDLVRDKLGVSVGVQDTVSTSAADVYRDAGNLTIRMVKS